MRVENNKNEDYKLENKALFQKSNSNFQTEVWLYNLRVSHLRIGGKYG